MHGDKDLVTSITGRGMYFSNKETLRQFLQAFKFELKAEK